MSLGGLGLALVNLRNRKTLKRCERCGLHSEAQSARCAHCADLSDRELESYLEGKRGEQQQHGQLGRQFLVLAALLFVALLLFALA